MITPLRTSLAALGLLAALIPGAAEAAVLVTTSTLAPTSSFAESTAVAGGIQWRNNPANGLRDVGQSFYVASSLTLDSTTFRLAPDAAPGAGALTAAFNFSIYQVASSSGVPTAAPIYTESGNMAGLAGNSSDFSKYVTFDLTNVALTGGNYYAVMLSFPTSVANQSVTWQVSGASPTYTGGIAIISTNGSTFSGWGGGSDLVFYATAVPEPTVAILGLVGAGLVAFRSRQRLA